MPPDARAVWASRRARLPMTTTSAPAWWAAMAARSPAAPVPMTRTFAVWVRYMSFPVSRLSGQGPAAEPSNTTPLAWAMNGR